MFNIKKIIISSLLLPITFMAYGWELVSDDPFTIMAKDTSLILPIYFVCDYDGKIRVFQDDEDVSDKVISSDTGKIINNLYGIFYGDHSRIEVNDYFYVVHSVDEIEIYMRHCDG